MKKDRLGRGLGHLLDAYLGSESGDVSSTVPVAAISANPVQPRRHFDDDGIEELKESIRIHGLIQPLIVRPRPGSPGEYQLIAGERRLRSVQALGWDRVPVVIREASDDTLLILALVENLQRRDLNPLEEAEGFRTLVADFGLSQEEVARSVGRSRPAVTNSLRLLRSPDVIKDFVRDGKLSMGHARALLAVPDPERAVELAERAVEEGWSVRETERNVGVKRRRKAEVTDQGSQTSPMFQIFEEALTDHLSTSVTIQRRRGNRGAVRIAYKNHRELENIVELVTGRPLESIAD
ncbi:MAG: ParB/RepB/Spo0J family partition protein [Gemmatimonadetes bacterium]|nr:ParB/RepB/Spo0J family partition protein [Gemmatimonadota bacterium]